MRLNDNMTPSYLYGKILSYCHYIERKEFTMLMSGKELRVKEYVDNKELVTDLLPNGVTLFAGKPKIGKSFLLLQLAISLCNNNSDFFDLRTDNANVVYFSNETNAREIKKRLENLGKPYDNMLLNFSNSIDLKSIETEIAEVRKQLNRKYTYYY